MSNLETFTALHQQGEMLVIGNAWNAQSALVLEQSGCRAL